MQRYDLKISRENGTCLSVFDSVDKGDYVKHEDVQKLIIELVSYLEYYNLPPHVFVSLEKTFADEGFEVKE